MFSRSSPGAPGVYRCAGASEEEGTRERERRYVVRCARKIAALNSSVSTGRSSVCVGRRRTRDDVSPSEGGFARGFARRRCDGTARGGRRRRGRGVSLSKERPFKGRIIIIVSVSIRGGRRSRWIRSHKRVAPWRIPRIPTPLIRLPRERRAVRIGRVIFLIVALVNDTRGMR